MHLTGSLCAVTSPPPDWCARECSCLREAVRGPLTAVCLCALEECGVTSNRISVPVACISSLILMVWKTWGVKLNPWGSFCLPLHRQCDRKQPGTWASDLTSPVLCVCVCVCVQEEGGDHAHTQPLHVARRTTNDAHQHCDHHHLQHTLRGISLSVYIFSNTSYDACM